jgi:hypothetical protein
MKKILLIMLPVLALSVVGIAQSESFGVKQISENYYEVQSKTSISPADQTQILGLIKKAYGLDEVEGNVKLSMMPAAAGDVIVLADHATQDLFPQRTVGLWRSAQMLTPEAAAISNILKKYVN